MEVDIKQRTQNGSLWDSAEGLLIRMAIMPPFVFYMQEKIQELSRMHAWMPNVVNLWGNRFWGPNRKLSGNLLVLGW